MVLVLRCASTVRICYVGRRLLEVSCCEARRLLQIHCMTYRGGTTISSGIHANLIGQMKMSVIERCRRRADVIDAMNTNLSLSVVAGPAKTEGNSARKVQLHAL